MMRKTIFLVFALFVVSAGVSYSGTVDLPQTGQTKCYNSIGTEILCAGTRQDGEIQVVMEFELDTSDHRHMCCL